MRKLVLALCLALAAPAHAATTWPVPQLGSYRAIAACTTGTEAAPVGLVGLELSQITGFAVHLQAAGATTAGTLQAYLYNPETSTWSRAPDLDIAIPAGVTTYASAGFTVTARIGRVAFLPSGIGQASSVYIIGARR